MNCYWESEKHGLRLYHGDCLEILPGLSGVDAVVTDPPYGTGAWKRPSAGAGSDCSAVMQREAWDNWDDSWVRLTDAVTIGMFLPQTRLAEFRRLFLCVKSDPRPRFSGQPSYAIEPFAIVRGRVREIGGTDVYVASAPRENRDAEAEVHPHQKPTRVMKWLVTLCSDAGQLILDPFLGSGTTLVACYRTGRKGIGIELEEKYCEIAAKRCEREIAQGRLFPPQPPKETQGSLIA